MRNYGIMQGRLTPSDGRGIQFFPFDNWMNEFEVGSKIGLNEIEWVFDYYRYENNPIWTSQGIKQIEDVIGSTEVKVLSVCFDYFMRRPFYKQDSCSEEKYRKENLEFVKRVIYGMRFIGANILEIPMVDDSAVKTDEERKKVIDFLHDVLEYAEDADILIGCETDMGVGSFKDFLDEIDHSRIKANYDSGNSSGLGYDHTKELHSLNEYVVNVHIKDRVYQGDTVSLGKGSADFNKVFRSLKEIGYGGSIILQAARGIDGDETKNIMSQLSFVKEYCRIYNME